MAHNKIVIVTSTSRVEDLPDVSEGDLARQGGGLCFRRAFRRLRYFAEAEHQHQFGAELGACPSCGTTRPEFIFDVLETPLRDLSGDVIYEENSRGQLVPSRRYSPDFWRDKYEAFRLIQDVKQSRCNRRRPTRCRSHQCKGSVCRCGGTMNGRNFARCCGVLSRANYATGQIS